MQRHTVVMVTPFICSWIFHIQPLAVMTRREIEHANLGTADKKNTQVWATNIYFHSKGQVSHIFLWRSRKSKETRRKSMLEHWEEMQCTNHCKLCSFSALCESRKGNKTPDRTEVTGVLLIPSVLAFNYSGPLNTICPSKSQARHVSQPVSFSVL